MPTRIPALVITLIVGMAVGCSGTYLLTSARVDDLVASSYQRSASDARAFAQTLEDVRAHRDTQAISRLEANLSAALIALGDYETVFAADQRDPRVYDALTTARDYLAGHPDVDLPPDAAKALAMGSAAAAH
ncbi:MAG TPA: hypothetical protein VFS55_15245 [Dokdonella sp.]|nr:hypothetical protein [Dokdonella sp.]